MRQFLALLIPGVAACGCTSLPPVQVVWEPTERSPSDDDWERRGVVFCEYATKGRVGECTDVFSRQAHSLDAQLVVIEGEERYGDGVRLVAYAYRSRDVGPWDPGLSPADLSMLCAAAFSFEINEWTSERIPIYLEATSPECEVGWDTIVSLVADVTPGSVRDWSDDPFPGAPSLCPGQCGPPDGGLHVRAKVFPRRCNHIDPDDGTNGRRTGRVTVHAPCGNA